MVGIKLNKFVAYTFIFIVFIIIIITTDKNYTFENYEVYLDIKENGQIHATHILELSPQSHARSFSITINDYNIKNLKIRQIYPSREDLGFAVYKNLKRKTNKVHFNILKENSVIELTYDIDNGITKYKDINMLKFKLLDKINQLRYKNISIKMNFESKANMSVKKIYQTSYFEEKAQYKEGKLIANYDEYPLSNELSLTVLFIQNNTNRLNINEGGFETISSEELKNEKMINIKKIVLEYLNNFGKYSMIFALTIVVFGMYFDNKVKFTCSNRNFHKKCTFEHSPAIYNRINNNKNTLQDFISNIIHLINKGVIEIEIKENKSKIEYSIKLIKEDINYLELNEKYIIDLLFFNIFKEKAIQLLAVKQMINTRKNEIKFKKSLKVWRKKVEKDCKNMGYLSNWNKFAKSLVSLIWMIHAVALIIYIFELRYYSYNYYYLLVDVYLYGIFYILYSKSLKNRKEMKKIAFFKKILKKNFIFKKDFDNVWEYYLPYIISFDLYRDTRDNLRHVIKDGFVLTIFSVFDKNKSKYLSSDNKY